MKFALVIPSIHNLIQSVSDLFRDEFDKIIILVTLNVNCRMYK